MSHFVRHIIKGDKWLRQGMGGLRAIIEEQIVSPQLIKSKYSELKILFSRKCMFSNGNILESRFPKEKYF